MTNFGVQLPEYLRRETPRNSTVAPREYPEASWSESAEGVITICALRVTLQRGGDVVRSSVSTNLPSGEATVSCADCLFAAPAFVATTVATAIKPFVRLRRVRMTPSSGISLL